MREAWRRFLDAVFGPRCSCGQRVFPKDATSHRYDHTPEGGATA